MKIENQPDINLPSAQETARVATSEADPHRRRLEAICNNVSVALFITDEHQHCAYMNPAAEEMTGYTLSELQGDPLHNFIHHTHPDGTPCPIEECPINHAFLQNNREQGEDIFVHRDGSFYPGAFTASPLREEGAVVGTIFEVRNTTREKQAEATLRAARDELGKRVEQRNAELAQANKLLEKQIAQLKQAEVALTASESQLKAVQRIAHLGDWERDLSTNLINASNEFWRIFLGAIPEEPVPRYETFHKYIHPEDRGLLFDVITKTPRAGKSFELEFRVIRADGSEGMVCARGEVITNEAGEPIKVRGIAQDITNRKRAEEKIRRQKEILQKIFDHIPLMISFWDEKGRIKLINREWERTRGWTLEEIQNNNVDVLAESFPDPQYRQEVQGHIAAGSGEWKDWKTLSKGGRVVNISWSNLRLSDGTTISFGQDVTERRRAEAALRQSERDYRTLFRQAHDAILIFDPESKIILNLNQRACEIYGYSKDEMMRMSLEEITKDIDRVKRQINKTLETGRAYQFETAQHRKDGSLMHLEINASLIEYKGRQAILSINRDVTHLKRAKDERDQLMQRLLTAQEDERRRISRELHDHMGQYLAALMLGLKSIQKTAGLPSPAQERVVMLQELTTTLSQEMRHFALELSPPVLDDLGLSQALTNYIEEWSKLNEIEIDLHSNGLIDKRLPAQIETTLFRLVQEALNNVVKHSQAQHVSVIMEYRERRVMAVLEDDGTGFDVAAAISAPVSMRGLGLTSMRERVESVGGTFQIESVPGTGTTIVARIPAPPREG